MQTGASFEPSVTDCNMRNWRSEHALRPSGKGKTN